MFHRRVSGLISVTAVLLITEAAFAQNNITSASADSYGSFETAGVWITLNGDANHNAAATATITATGGSQAPTEVHPFVRFDASHMATSIFGLSPGSRYDVQITITDPDGVAAGATQAAHITTRADTILPAALREFYVSTSGSDSANGDRDHPFLTIQHALSRTMAGDQVHVTAGRYREAVSFPSSGTHVAPIALLADPGAILDGSDATIASSSTAWTNTNGVFSAPISYDSHYAAIDGQRLYHATTCPPPSTGTHAPGDWCIANAQLYLRLPSGQTPTGHSVEVSQLDAGVTLDGVHDIWIDGLDVRNFGNSEFGKGIYLRGASDNVIRNCAVHNDLIAIWIKVGDHNVIEDNDVYDTSVSSWPWVDVKLHDSESAGIYISDAVGVGNVIRRNHVHGTFDGVDFCGDSAGAITTENDVNDNVIDDHLDDGSEADGSCINARVFRNIFKNTHMGISLAPAQPGPLFITRNVIMEFGFLDPIDTSSSFKFNNGYPEVTQNVLIYHNTIYTTQPMTPALWLGAPGHAQGVVFRNNILVGTAYALEAADDNDDHVAMDYDDLFTTDSTRFVRWWDGSAVQHYMTRADFVTGTSNEMHGISAAPTFVNVTTGDMRPAPNSPVIDQGTIIPGISVPFSGSAPDLGAFELGSAQPDSGVVRDASSNVDVVVDVSAMHEDGRVTTSDAGDGGSGGSVHQGCSCRTVSQVSTRFAVSWIFVALGLLAVRRRR